MNGQQANSDQLSLFGISKGENFFMSEKWGLLTFHPAKSDKWNDTCRHCLLWVPCENWSQDDECLRAPCYADDRADHQRGYFSIQDFPKRKEAAV